MKDFLHGLHCCFAGFCLLFCPGAKRYVLIPLLINLSLFIGGFLLGYNLLTELTTNLQTHWEWFSWLSWLLYPLFILLWFTLVFFCFSLLANLIAAPFNSLLSYKVEKILTKNPIHDANSSQTLLAMIVSSFSAECNKLMYILLRAIPLLILCFIPGLQIITPMLWLCFGAWMLAIEYIDYPLGNHGSHFKEQSHILQKNRMLVFGFGTGVSLLMLLPIINFLAMPTAVCGATKLYLQRLRPAINLSA